MAAQHFTSNSSTGDTAWKVCYSSLAIWAEGQGPTGMTNGKPHHLCLETQTGKTPDIVIATLLQASVLPSLPLEFVFPAYVSAPEGSPPPLRHFHLPDVVVTASTPSGSTLEGNENCFPTEVQVHTLHRRCGGQLSSFGAAQYLLNTLLTFEEFPILWFLPPNGRNENNHVPRLWQLRHKQVTERQQGWPRSYSRARCGIDTTDSTSGDKQFLAVTHIVTCDGRQRW